MDVLAYKEAVDRTGTAQLTLTNGKDSHFVGDASTVVHQHDQLKFKWKVTEDHDWYKYTHALFHVGFKVYLAYEINDIHIAPDTGKIEVVFDLD